MKLKDVPFYARILAAMVLGMCLGLAAGKSVFWMGDVGRLIIQLIKVLAAPLLFFAVVDAFVRTHIRWKSGLIMVTVSLINAAVALLIGLGLSNWLEPGRHMDLDVAAAPSNPAGGIVWSKQLEAFLPSSIVQPFADGALIPLIVLAILAGVALRREMAKPEPSGARSGSRYHGGAILADAVTSAYHVCQTMLGWVVAWVPLAVFCVVAKTVGDSGFAPFKGLIWYVGVALLGLSLQVFLVYPVWIRFVAGMKLGTFFRGARDAIVYAMGASSSLATLPITLACLDKMKVSPRSARLAAGVGTNLNNDGILLYEAMAVLFVAQVHGIQLSLPQQCFAALGCLVASVGIAGVPDAGLISLSVVLATVGLPVEILPLLLTVDWLLSRARATTNVIADHVGAVVLDRLDREQPALKARSGA